MKILVIDDRAIHCNAAKAMLKDHELAVVSTYGEAQNTLLSSSYDVVLTDLLLPATTDVHGEGTGMVGQEMPLGTTLAFLALSRGVKYVAVVTDTNHHDHPASAAFDVFHAGPSGKNEVFSIGSVRVLCTNHPNDLIYVDERTFEPVAYDSLYSVEGEEKYPQLKGLVMAKNWAQILNQLLNAAA